jgi:23S rRNA G2445 N2-methylase RlmL
METFDLLLVCERGCAPAVNEELALKGFKGTITEHATCVTLSGVSKETLCRAAYTLQTPTAIAWLLGTTKIEPDLEESILHLETLLGTLPLPYNDLIPQGETFVVRCDREGTHDFTSVDLAQEAGRILKRHAKEDLGEMPLVDMKRPQHVFTLFVDEEEGWFGLDLVGRDPSKRAYKVFTTAHDLKGPVAASLLLFSGWRPGDTVLDPYTSGGVIPIEAALFATEKPLQFYDKTLACTRHPFFQEAAAKAISSADAKVREGVLEGVSAFDAQLRNVSSARKNAKIAGVDKAVSFSKMDIDWLDIKIEEKSIKHVVTRPIEASKHVPANRAMELHKELFFRAGYFLKKDGRMTFICQRPEDILSAGDQYGFAEEQQFQIFTGKLPLWVLTMKRK